MLNDLLQALKKAIKDGNEKEEKRLRKELNKLGMDDLTQNVLLKEI